MRTIRTALMAAALMAGAAGPGAAQDWIIGGDITRFSGDGPSAVPGLTLEAHASPQWEFGRVELTWGVAGSIDDRGGAWAGGGIAALVPVGENWYGEASIMPGYYRAGSAATDLGHRLQFRSLIGVGYILSRETSISVGLSHRSNAGLGDRNPGANTLSLRLRRVF